VLHDKGIYPLPQSSHQQTTPSRQIVNNFRSYHVTALLLAASVGRITKTIMRTTGRIIAIWPFLSGMLTVPVVQYEPGKLHYCYFRVGLIPCRSLVVRFLLYLLFIIKH